MGQQKLRALFVVAAALFVVTGTVAGTVPAVDDRSSVENRAIQPEPPVEVWNETFGRTGEDKLKAIAPTDDGGYLLVGQTETADGGADGWLMLVDDSGDRQFETTFGGPGEDRISDVVKTDDGYLLAGWRTTDGSMQGWLLKVDEQGVEQWEKTVGGPQWDGFWKLAEGTDGNYVAVGRSQFAAWAVTVDGQGEVAWNRTYAGGGNGSTFGAVAPTDDGFLLAGWTDTANGSEVGLAVRVNASGGEQWNRTYDADDGTQIWAAETTDDGFLLAGETNPADEPARGWARLVGTDGSVETRWTDDEPGSRFIDAVSVEDGFLLVGGANGSDAGYDMMAMRFDGDLERQWTATVGGSQWDLALSGIATEDGYLLVGATTSRGAGGQDGWFVKLGTSNESAD